ncbi:ADYC domain-containing protein [Nannocystis punicea]|uniref:ADYC domain-containing protein n=1 Tax=Nannocystis punicea TaxID=2995304 RepID=A0ABY7HFG1_9BACT|nr:ADYC domain-containing protein [Nannocystis poenicansa]WAS97832.1 ADYC domain-containing protein [Nannocystis poenicansa]
MTRGIWLALVCSVVACDVVENDVGTAVTLRSDVGNGLQLNSAVMNGQQFNGMRMNGINLNGMRMNNWSLNGINLNGINLNGSSFSATQIVDGSPVQVSGDDLVGSLLTLEGAGETYVLRFDDIYLDPADPDGDVWFYDISVQDVAESTWSSLCYDHNGQPTQAIAIGNWWDGTTGDRVDDAGVVTFACRDAVLAKCVEWGYRPWATVAGVSLADHHQACTRLARADYCGDGTPHTFTGTPIDVFDALSPAIQSPVTLTLQNWGIEAEWGPDGAVCVGEQRRLKMLDDAGITYEYPTCLDALDDISTCGDFDSSRGGLLADRYCDLWQSDPGACDGSGPS